MDFGKRGDGVSDPFMTYAIRAGRGNIKLGRSTCVERRLRDLQSASPEKLVVMGIWKSDIEDVLHVKFAHLRLHNEWFSPGLDLLKYIAEYSHKWIIPAAVTTAKPQRQVLLPLDQLMQQMSTSPIASDSICQMQITATLKRSLLSYGVETVQHLRNLSEQDLWKMINIRGIGVKSIAELERIIRPGSKLIFSDNPISGS